MNTMKDVCNIYIYINKLCVYTFLPRHQQIAGDADLNIYICILFVHYLLDKWHDETLMIPFGLLRFVNYS